MPAPHVPVGATARGAVRVVDTAAGRMIVEATPHGIARLDQVGPSEDVAAWFNVKHSAALGDDEPGGDEPDGDDVGGAVGGKYDDDDDEVGGRPAGGAAAHLQRVAEQLQAYCEGELREFDVPVDWAAAGVHDEFSREVYREIQRIPYGETCTYGQISMDAGRPRNARRVGRLCTIVPVAFVIPVHRVVRADGGMGRCPEYRLRLLEHERRNLAAPGPVAFQTV